jgi:SagB-type dehydrogenase family enzyme
VSAPSLGDRYWQRALHEAQALIPARRPDRPVGPPPPVASPQRRRHPLPAVPRVLGDPRASFHTVREAEPDAGPPARHRLDPAGLSALLHHSFGIARQELGPAANWPYHRPVPSARCLFPTEVRCWVPATGEQPEGVYSYDAAHHALAEVRRGDVLDALGAAVSADLRGAACVVVLSSVFARTAWRYGSYAYRLCTQEAGLVAGNVLLVAGALGLQGHVHHRFSAGMLDRLAGVSWPDESVMSVIALYPWHRALRRDVIARPDARWNDVAGELGYGATGGLGDGATGGLGAPRRDVVGSAASTERAGRDDVQVLAVPPLDRDACAELIEFDAASRANAPATPLPAGDRPVHVAEEPGADLAETLRRRWSGSATFAPVRRSLPASAVDRIVRYALDPHGSDVVAAGAPPPVECHLVLLAVQDTEPGVYRLRGGALSRLGPAEPLVAALPTTNVNHRDANVLVYLVVDRAAGTAALGDRSFRVLQQEAGIVAQRICVAAAAEALAARVHNGYPTDRVGAALGLSPGREPVFQIMLGTARPAEVYRIPIHFPESG